MGLQKKAFFILGGIGKGTFLVAEKLALQQGFRYGGAIDGHKGPISACAGQVQCSGDQFFSGAAFSFNKHVCIRLCGMGNLVQDGFHFFAFGNNVFKAVAFFDDFFKILNFFCKPAAFQTITGLHQKLLVVKRFGQIAIRPFFNGLHGTFDRAVGRQDDDRHFRVNLM